MLPLPLTAVLSDGIRWEDRRVVLGIGSSLKLVLTVTRGWLQGGLLPVSGSCTAWFGGSVGVDVAPLFAELGEGCYEFTVLVTEGVRWAGPGPLTFSLALQDEGEKI